jgi:protein-S-isoprenylcysteine O-methyltransferase Ste14
MDDLTSPAGALALAISALLLVVGYRLARPDRSREWLAIGAYAAAHVALLLGARGLLPGAALVPGPALRIGGVALLAAGLLLAGAPARARRRPAIAGSLAGSAPGRRLDPVYAGLALVLVGQLARSPSVAGGVAALAGVLVCLAVAAAPSSRRAPAAPN